MAFFKWLFYKRYPLYDVDALVKEELEIFENYIILFREKQKHILNWDKEWYKGNIRKLVRDVNNVKEIILRELRKEAQERHICKLIHSIAQSIGFTEDLKKLEEIISQLKKNLEQQLYFFKKFKNLPNEISHKLIINELIQKEEMLLFGEHYISIYGEKQVLSQILKSIKEKRERLQQRKKIIFPNIERNYSTIRKLDRYVCDEDVLTYLSQAGIGEPPQSYNEESKRIYLEYGFDFRNLFYEGGIAGTSLLIHEKDEIYSIAKLGYPLDKVVLAGPSRLPYWIYEKAHNHAVVAEHKYLESVARRMGYRLSLATLIITNPIHINPDICYPQFKWTEKARQSQIRDLEFFGIKGKLMNIEEIQKAVEFYKNSGFPQTKFNIVETAKKLLNI